MISEHGNVIYFAGDGSTTVFNYPFDVHQATDINLLLIDADGNTTVIESGFLVNTVLKTVTYPGYPPGQEPAEPPEPVQEGEKLCIYSLTPVTQDVDLPDKWPYDRIEAQMDKMCIIEQQNRAIFDRSLVMDFGVDVSNINLKLPKPVPDTILVWNNTGTALITTDLKAVTSALTEIARQYAEASATSASEAETSATEAATSASEAAASAIESANSASESAASATEAQNSADDAESSAQAAADSESDAKNYAENADTSASQAAAAAQSAQSLIETSLYDEDVTYEPGDTAMLSDGAVYRCITESTGEYPATSSKWVSVATTVFHTFEYNASGNLVPLLHPQASQFFGINENGNIYPKLY